MNDMKNLLIACEILRDEVEKTIEDSRYKGDVIFLDDNLHNDPDSLRAKLQEVVDDNTKYDNILLSYGSCGNATVGLKARSSNLIIPVTADCISMLLCEVGELEDLRRKTYFLTKGWIEGKNSLKIQYDHCVKKYGKTKADMIFKVMLNNYKYLTLINSGAYDMEKYMDISSEIAKITGLELLVKPGSLSLLEKLLKGIWDSDFCIIKPGDEVRFSNFGISTGVHLNTI